MEISTPILTGVLDDTSQINRLLGLSYYVLIRMPVLFTRNALLVSVSVRLSRCPTSLWLLVEAEHRTWVALNGLQTRLLPLRSAVLPTTCAVVPQLLRNDVRCVPVITLGAIGEALVRGHFD